MTVGGSILKSRSETSEGEFDNDIKISCSIEIERELRAMRDDLKEEIVAAASSVNPKRVCHKDSFHFTDTVFAMIYSVFNDV